MNDIKSMIVKSKPSAPSKFIIIGDPMSGKTTLASKAPKPLFISTDGNAAKAGLDAIAADSLGIVRETIEFFKGSNEYETLVIDTVEGIADLFESIIIYDYNQEKSNRIEKVTSLTDVPYGILTGKFNKKIAAFAETLSTLEKNVVILSYTKRQLDDVSGSIILGSELKGIRNFTRFSDGVIMCSYDGEKFESRVVNRRTVVSGDIEYGDIEPFLIASGWELPKRKVKISSIKK